jgi:putative ABC transport system permease protein
MSWVQLAGALEIGLIYGFVAIGVYISFRILKFPDLSVDGSFPLGAAVCGALLVQGIHPGWATAGAVLAGALSGWVTAILSTRLKILNLLAGILTFSALYSVNLRVLGGRPNLSLLGQRTLFSPIEQDPTLKLLILLLGLAVVVALGVLFFKTELGLSIRAAGANARMAKALGISESKAIQIGISISNAWVALAGALLCQLSGFADVSMGVGTVVIGLASVIIGEALIQRRSILFSLASCVLGSLVYRVLISLALNSEVSGLQGGDLNLLTTALVVGAMVLPRILKGSRLNCFRGLEMRKAASVIVQGVLK